ncbi:MAG: hypothetical protein DME22_22930, partial [Verrucomicrobia bacterium]
YAGINTLAKRHGVAIVGGETTINPGRMLISASVLGTVPRGKSPLRSGAKAGDAIFVTGELGGSLSGKHLEFEPRLSEARWLAENPKDERGLPMNFPSSASQKASRLPRTPFWPR